ncbi:MAG: hypothetical protein KJ749_04725 [Planctomycetes bacterium]|nr:hypothetical protein [Planctomycetota bacterium]
MRKCVKWGSLIGCLVIIWHMITVAITGGKPTMRLPNGAEIGSNGMVIRYLWTPSEKQSIAWDEIGSRPRWVFRDYLVFVQVPLYIPMMVLASLTGLLFHIDRRRMSRSRGDGDLSDKNHGAAARAS